MPGKYKSPNPGGYCYSARLTNNDGALGDIIDNDIHQGQALLTVKASDGYVEVTGCTSQKTGWPASRRTARCSPARAQSR